MTRKPELVREFIHDCLYNPRDGYFQRHVNIFSSGSAPIDFPSIRDQDEYLDLLASMYKEQTKDLKHYQLWHTPSELFRPCYGRGIANHIIQWAERSLTEGDSVVIYEVGPGNGTLCDDIIKCIKELAPRLYHRLEYNLVEISRHLIDERLLPLEKTHGQDLIRIHNRSFLDWRWMERRPCFVMAMEVFDNLPQDRIRFTEDGSLEQAMIITNDEARYQDDQARYTEAYIPVQDQLIIDTVNAMDQIGHQWPSLRGTLLETMQSIWPLTAFQFTRPWSKEFIPTGPYLFLRTLCKYFPNHAFLMTDFDGLPDAIDGHGGPVVQTRYDGETVACSTYLLQRGLFDIFFPINFSTISKIYHLLGGKSALIKKHQDFCKSFKHIEQTRTKSGYNPMLEDFENVSFMYTQ